MTHQQLSQASSTEEYAYVRKILDDAIDCYMPIGGPSLARAHVEILGNELQKLYPGCTMIYYEVLARVCQAEKEEQERAEARRFREQQQMMIDTDNRAREDAKAAVQQMMAQRQGLPM